MLEYMLALAEHKPRFKLVPLKDAPHAASHRSACLFNNKIYTVGGLNGSTVSVNNFSVYDIASDTWTVLPVLPIATRNGTFGAYGNRLVYAGGYNQGPNIISTAIYTYNLTTNQWSLASNQQSPGRFETAYETLSNGMLYALGGTSGSILNVSQSMNLVPTTTTFANLLNMNEGTRAAGSLYDGTRYIYVAGGVNATTSFITTFQRYDIVSNTWQTLAAIPVGCSYVHMLIYRDVLYALATGQTGNIYVNHIYAYDIAKNTWSDVGPLAGEVHGLTKAIQHNGEVFLIGGYNGTSRLAKVSKLVRY